MEHKKTYRTFHFETTVAWKSEFTGTLLVAILVIASDNKLMQGQPSALGMGLSWQSPQ
jgi:hypothetical protein